MDKQHLDSGDMKLDLGSRSYSRELERSVVVHSYFTSLQEHVLKKAWLGHSATENIICRHRLLKRKLLVAWKGARVCWFCPLVKLLYMLSLQGDT